MGNELLTAAKERVLMQHRQLNVDAALYHSVPNYYGSSQLKHALKTPLHFKTAVLDRAGVSEAPSRAQQLGTCAHSAVLENNFNAFKTAPPEATDRRTKAWKEAEAEAEAENRILLTREEAFQINRMHAAFWINATVSTLMKRITSVEESFFCHDFETNIGMKARPDALGHNIIIDYKTSSRGVDADSFQKTIVDYGYDFSAAHYSSVIEQVTGMTCDFYWIVQETEAPFSIQVYKASDACLQRAESTRKAALRTLGKSFITDKWPGYDEAVKEIDIPAWAAKKVEVVA
jgi:exodeoxyribonuclease VIII